MVKMVKTFQDYLGPDCHRTYSCVHCRAHLAPHAALVSKVFTHKYINYMLLNKHELDNEGKLHIWRPDYQDLPDDNFVDVSCLINPYHNIRLPFRFMPRVTILYGACLILFFFCFTVISREPRSSLLIRWCVSISYYIFQMISIYVFISCQCVKNTGKNSQDFIIQQPFVIITD